MPLDDIGPPLPWTYQDLREPPQKPEEHATNPPSWKRLIGDTLTIDERVSLITAIFSDRNQAKMVGYLSGDDAHTFINMMDEVSHHTHSAPKGWASAQTSTPRRLGTG